jgi:hypothetical protein
VPPCVMCRQVTAATRLPLPSMEAHVMFLAGHDPIEVGGELADQAGMGAPRCLSGHGWNPPRAAGLRWLGKLLGKDLLYALTGGPLVQVL